MVFWSRGSLTNKRAVQVESGTYCDENWGPPIHLKDHTFSDNWNILFLSHNGKISKIHLKTSWMTLVQNVLILIPFYHKRAKTGLWSRFYLNCSHKLSKSYTFAVIKHSLPKFHNWILCTGIILTWIGAVQSIPVVLTVTPWQSGCERIEEKVEGPAENNIVVTVHHKYYDCRGISYS